MSINWKWAAATLIAYLAFGFVKHVILGTPHLTYWQGATLHLEAIVAWECFSRAMRLEGENG